MSAGRANVVADAATPAPGVPREVMSGEVVSRDPATGAVWRRHTAATADDVARAVDRARAAQPAWHALGVRARSAILERFRRALVARRAEVADCIMRENGKPVLEALGTEVLVALDYAAFYARTAPRALREEASTPASVAMWRKRLRTRYQPYGVVGVVSPWNYPFMLPAGVVLPALVAGNAVVLKPSELTPTSGVLLGELLREAGVPDDVMQVLPGDGTAGAALVARADKISFTGSVATGRKVAVACAERLVPCSLELGGSDPALVLDDADVATAARGIAWARFTNAGQTCVAPKRVLVAARVHDAFLAALSRQVEGLRVGAGSRHDVDVGPLVHPSQLAALEGQLADALEKGARIAARTPLAADAAGYFAPTVLTGVTPEMRVMREETFGPLLPVYAVRDDADAIRAANASEFGLSASVWTRDPARAAAVAAQLEAGTVAINDAAIVAGIAEVPHGGVKASGLGRAHGVAGLMEFVHTHTVVDERLPGLHQPWWFGYDAAARDAIDAVIRLAHGTSLADRVRGARGALPLLRKLRGQPRPSSSSPRT